MITSFFKPKRDRTSANTTASETPIGKENSTASKKQKTFHKAGKKSPETLRLISHLKNGPGEEPTWATVLDKHFSSPSFGRLASFVETQRASKTIFPPEADTFAALNLCPLSKTKVVIVGQDPYHGPKQAHGLCFSVRRGIQTPPSLKNIYKELLADENIENFRSLPIHGNLERWAQQGVLLINNVLTVQQGQAHSHKKKGWESFTDTVIRLLDAHATKGIVFLLWGKPATEKAKTALLGSKHKHTIICTSHPSPLGATKTKAPFLGSRCFSRANQALKELGHDQIDWRVDGKLPETETL